MNQTFPGQGIKPVSDEAARAREMEQKERDRMSQFEFFTAQAALPKRQVANRKNIKKEGEWNNTCQRISQKLHSGFLISLVGGRGAGKTQMAVEIALACMRGDAGRQQKQALYVTAMEFFLAIKGTFGKDQELTEEDIMRKFRRPSLLVIDEFSQRAESEWENRLLYELIDSRYRDMKDTLIIDNQTTGAFQAMIGDSMASRMNETGGIIDCNWPSFRE